MNGGYLNEFPGSDDYKGDLGWLIKYYKKLSQEYSELLEIVKNLQNSYDTIPQQVQDAVNNAMISINNRMKDLENSMKNLQGDMKSLESNFSTMYATMNTLNIAIRQFVTWENEKLIAKVNTAIAKMTKEYPMLIDPVDYNLEPLQTILFHMSNRFSLGIQVEVLEAMNIPVEILEGWKLDVWDIEWYGKEIFKRWKYYYMFSPFNGEYVPIADVVQQLYNLHYPGVKVEDIQNKNIEVKALEDMNIDVYEMQTTSQWFNNIT